jgi:hypothetical protein
LRAQIWANLLKGVKDHKADPSRLSRWPLNGRQIKHAIKMGMILAMDQQSPLTTSLLYSVLADSHGPLWKAKTRALIKRVRG